MNKRKVINLFLFSLTFFLCSSKLIESDMKDLNTFTNETGYYLTANDIKYKSFYIKEEGCNTVNITLNLSDVKNDSQEILIEYADTKIIIYNELVPIAEYEQGKNFIRLNRNLLGSYIQINCESNSNMTYQHIILDYVESYERKLDSNEKVNYQSIYKKEFNFTLENPNTKFIALKSKDDMSLFGVNIDLYIQYFNESNYMINSMKEILAYDSMHSLSYLQFVQDKDTKYIKLTFNVNIENNELKTFEFLILDPIEIDSNGLNFSFNQSFIEGLNGTPKYYYFNLEKSNNISQVVIRYYKQFLKKIGKIFTWSQDSLIIKQIQLNMYPTMKVYQYDIKNISICIDPNALNNGETIEDNKYYIILEDIIDENTKIYEGYSIHGNQMAVEDYKKSTIFCGIIYDKLFFKLLNTLGISELYTKENTKENGILDGFTINYDNYFYNNEEKDFCLKINIENSTNLYSLSFYNECIDEYSLLGKNNELFYSIYIPSGNLCYLDNVNYYNIAEDFYLRLPLDVPINYSKNITLNITKANETEFYDAYLNEEIRYQYFLMADYKNISTYVNNMNTYIDLIPITEYDKKLIVVLNETTNDFIYPELTESDSLIKDINQNIELIYENGTKISLISFKLDKKVLDYKNVKISIDMQGGNQFLVYWKFYGKCDHPLFDTFTIQNPVFGPLNFSKTFVNDYFYKNVNEQDEVCLLIYYEQKIEESSESKSYSLKIEYTNKEEKEASQEFGSREEIESIEEQKFSEEQVSTEELDSSDEKLSSEEIEPSEEKLSSEETEHSEEQISNEEIESSEEQGSSEEEESSEEQKYSEEQIISEEQIPSEETEKSEEYSSSEKQESSEDSELSEEQISSEEIESSEEQISSEEIESSEEQISSEEIESSEEQISSEEQESREDEEYSEEQISSEEIPSSEEHISSEELPSSEEQISSEEIPSSEEQISSEEISSSEEQISSEDKEQSDEKTSNEEKKSMEEESEEPYESQEKSLEPTTKSGLEAWEIALIAIFSAIALALIIFIIYWFTCRKKKGKDLIHTELKELSNMVPLDEDEED